MKAELIVKNDRIEAKYKRDKYCNGVTAIAFHVVMGEWSVATSVCLPSNIDEAKAVKECFDMAFKALDCIEI